MGMNLPDNPVEKLMTIFDYQSDIAAFCFVSRSTVTLWKNEGKIPPWHIAALSRYTSIPPWELCPQHFTKPEEEDVSDQTKEA
jgi:hypothetical protein